MVISIFTGTVTAAKDISSPKITYIDPGNNAHNIPSNKVLKILFNEPVKPGSKYVEIKSSDHKQIPLRISLSSSNRILTITPTVSLSNRKYYLFLHSGSYTDLTGNPLPYYSSSFTVNSSAHLQNVYIQKLQSDCVKNGIKYYAKYAIYQKPANSLYWNRYLFYHIVSPPQLGFRGENDYRIYKLQDVILGADPKYFPYIKSSTDLTVPGNWEKALALTSTTKVGGMHGYEQYTGIGFYLNGKQVLPNISNSVLSCDDLKISEISDLYNPKNPRQVIAKTNTVYEWNGENLRIHTIYNWKVKETVTEAYVAMFPIKNDPTVASFGQIKGQNMENFHTRTTALRANSPEAIVWNNINTLHMSMEILNPEIALNNYLNTGNSTSGETWFRSNGYYNKLYITRVKEPGLEKVKDTTVWNIQTQYNIWDE